jgi:membrane-associated phospholipid phosphatase
MSHWPGARNTLNGLSWATLVAATALPLGAALTADNVGKSDVIVPLEAAGAALATVETVKHIVHRPRPYAHYCEPPAAGALCKVDSRLSFFSGHTAAAFAAATAAGEIARMKGYRNATTIRSTGLALAAATGLLRTAADRHYLSDVVVGAAVGWAIGKGVARLHKPEAEPDTASAVGSRGRGASPSAQAITFPLRSFAQRPGVPATIWFSPGTDGARAMLGLTWVW